MPTLQRVTYEQFGRSFINLVVTPELIAATLDAQLGAAIPIEQKVTGATVSGTVTPGKCRATRLPDKDGDDDIDVTIPLQISLHVEILNILDEDYEVSANVELELDIRTLAQLNIYIDVEPLEPANVTLQVTTSSWLKVAERLGNLEDQIKEAICTQFNERVNQSQAARTIDLLARVRASLPATPAR